MNLPDLKGIVRGMASKSALKKNLTLTDKLVQRGSRAKAYARFHVQSISSHGPLQSHNGPSTTSDVWTRTGPLSVARDHL